MTAQVKVAVIACFALAMCAWVLGALALRQADQVDDRERPPVEMHCDLEPDGSFLCREVQS